MTRRNATRHDAPSHYARLNRRRVANVALSPAWNCPALSEWSTMALTQEGSKAMGLKELRTKRGLTQRQLADKSGVHYVEIAQIETRKRNVRTLSLDTALRLCDALRVANPRKLLDSDETSAD